MAQHGNPELHNYVDDLFYFGLPSKIQSAYDFILQLLQELGLDISVKKLHPSRHSGGLFRYIIRYS